MNYIYFIFLSLIFSSSCFTEAKPVKNLAVKRRRQVVSYVQLRRALKSASQGNYTNSTKQLFLLMHKPALKKHKNKIRYQLALNFYNMKLYHPAIFQFQVLVANQATGYVGKSLNKIALMASYLQNDELLKHAIANGSVNYISRSKRSDLHYHFGEYWMRKKKFHKAIAHFARVKSYSPFFYKGLYQLGLVHAELNYLKKAVNIFNKLEDRKSGVTDNYRVAALLGKARSYYQLKKWDRSVEAYQEIPKDSSFWHDALFEKSWALMRGGKLRSALSNFHTMHSSYYAQYYQPESLLLRSIIYLYICKYYEMEKVLDLFELTYRKIYKNVQKIIRDKYSRRAYYQSVLLSADEQKKGVIVRYPLSIARRILREGDFAVSHSYIMKLKNELNLIYKQPYSWRRSKVGKYSIRLIKNRITHSSNKAGQQALNHLKNIRGELKSFFTQAQYLQYEMLRSKRGLLKKKIAQTISKVNIDDFDRSFYIQNGYEYWPFQNEYWLDELGNYHYLGKETCRK